MIKNLCLVLATLGLASTLHANTTKLVTVNCEAPASEFVNHFALTGQFEADVENGAASGLVKASLTAAGKNQSPTSLDESVSGTFQVFEAGVC